MEGSVQALMKRGRESPSDLGGESDFQNIQVGSEIHFFGQHPPVFNPNGFTHLSYFPSGYVGPTQIHRPIRFGYTTGDTVTGDISGGCSRTNPQYPLTGDHGPFCVLYVQKTDSGTKVVQKWIITAADRDAMLPRFNMNVSSDASATFGRSALTEPVPPTPPAWPQLLTNEQIIALLNDPIHGNHIREMVSMAVAIRDISTQKGAEQLKKFK